MPAHPTDPIEKKSVVDQLADKLRQRILSNEIQAGEALRQEALAEAYGVSRMPIREAFRQLEAEGLVTFNPHRGVVVSEMSIDEVEELFDLRALIETDLIRRAASQATGADHQAARDILERSHKAYERGEVEHWGELNRAFHSALYAPAGRPRAMQVLDTLSLNLDRYIRLQLSLTRSAPERAHEEHSTILDAYISKDLDRLGTALKSHIHHARNALLQYMRERPEFDV